MKPVCLLLRKRDSEVEMERSTVSRIEPVHIHGEQCLKRTGFSTWSVDCIHKRQERLGEQGRESSPVYQISWELIPFRFCREGS